MTVVARVVAPKGIVLVEDYAGGELPLVIPGRLVAATATCIAVGCMALAATEVTLSEIGAAPPFTDAAAFEGRLLTPTHTLAVRSLHGATLLSATVPLPSTLVRIWTNRPAEPDRIVIEIGWTA
jgi:hypothetical protein